MKNLFMLSTCFFLVFYLATPQEGSMKLYGIRSGIIEYSYSGDKVGKGTLYFSDYGLKSAMYTEVITNGEQTKGWVVTTGDTQFMWDPSRPDEGMKAQNPMVAWMKEAAKGSLDAFYETTYSQIGFTKGQNETFLGKNCMTMKGDMGKLLFWNGIMMYMDMKMGAFNSHQEVTSLKTDVPVDAKYFAIPKNIKFSEMPVF